MTTTFLVPRNSASSKLAAAITATATSLTVLSGEGARFPSTFPYHLTIDSEIVRVTARTGDVMTITRAQEGTAAASHSTGAAVRLNITAKAISDLNSAVNALETAPPAHKTSHENGGSDELSVAGLSGVLADAQIPADHKTSHQYGGSDQISLAGLSGETATPQPPKSHASSHQAGGSDAIKLDDLAAPDDNTDLDVSTSRHGLAPKAPNDTSKFLRGDATWALPSSNPCNVTLVKKTADETVYNSGVLQNDDELYMSIAASEKWAFIFLLTYLSNSTADFYFKITAPSGATINYSLVWQDTSGVVVLRNSDGSGGTSINGLNARGTIQITGTIVNSTNSGSLQLQWCQAMPNTSNTIVYAGSCLLACKIA